MINWKLNLNNFPNQTQKGLIRRFLQQIFDKYWSWSNLLSMIMKNLKIKMIRCEPWVPLDTEWVDKTGLKNREDKLDSVNFRIYLFLRNEKLFLECDMLLSDKCYMFNLWLKKFDFEKTRRLFFWSQISLITRYIYKN